MSGNSSAPPAAAIQAALSAAENVAAEASAPVVIVLTDAGGLVCGLLRMPGSFLASSDYAEWKAWTAASFSMSTLEFSDVLDSLGEEVKRGLLAHRKVTVLPGGVPVRVNDTVIAAIGISGGPAEVDEACAAAARAAFLAALECI